MLRLAPDPRMASGPRLAPGYSTRQQMTAERAALLMVACDVALSHRRREYLLVRGRSASAELRRLRLCAGEALGSAVSWLR